MTRRSLLRSGAVAGSAAAVGAVSGGTASAASGAPAPAQEGSLGDFRTSVATPDDPRYPQLVSGENRRWVGTPDYVVVVDTADAVVAAVQMAVDQGKQLAVRSGGHCYEGFVSDPSVKVVIDVSSMRSVTFDGEMGAFAIEPGATLGEVYATLYKAWGVTIPGGTCLSVGAGGHILGGGYGALSRLYGLTVDYLYGVEVVVVGADGQARKVVATRDAEDPALRDLWWGHTGGGGGNFGIVTMYWMRHPHVAGDDPSLLLPQPPSQLLMSVVTWLWSGLTQNGFSAMVRNYGTFFEQNSDPGNPYLHLFSELHPLTVAAGACQMVTQIDATLPNAQQLLNDFIGYVNNGVGLNPIISAPKQLPWLLGAEWPTFGSSDPTTRAKYKSAYMRTGFPQDQIDAMYRQLTRTDYTNNEALLVIRSYGGAINTIAPDATASAQRDSIMKMQYMAFWTAESGDAANIGWLRDIYQDVYAATGGVPVPNAVTDGCFVNYADVDLADPAQNTSGVPWSTLYYKDNYPRLRRVKAAWDPTDVFHHAESIELP
jgi:hypothetical protein